MEKVIYSVHQDGMLGHNSDRNRTAKFTDAIIIGLVHGTFIYWSIIRIEVSKWQFMLALYAIEISFEGRCYYIWYIRI